MLRVDRINQAYPIHLNSLLFCRAVTLLFKVMARLPTEMPAYTCLCFHMYIYRNQDYNLVNSQNSGQLIAISILSGSLSFFNLALVYIFLTNFLDLNTCLQYSYCCLLQCLNWAYSDGIFVFADIYWCCVTDEYPYLFVLLYSYSSSIQ